MKTMKLGKTGIDISRIGLGTWSIGGGSAWGGDHDLQVVVDTIRELRKQALTLLIRLRDTTSETVRRSLEKHWRA